MKIDKIKEKYLGKEFTKDIHDSIGYLVRIIKPNMFFTCDYYPDRFNVNVNEENIIEDIWMG